MKWLPTDRSTIQLVWFADVASPMSRTLTEVVLADLAKDQ
jgi:hypothetical protein